MRGSPVSCLQKAVFEVFKQMAHYNPFIVSKRFTMAVYVAVVILLLSGCSFKKDMGAVSRGEETISFHKIAVIPFQSVIPEDSSVAFVRCPVCGIFFSTSTSPGEPEKIIEEIFIKKLMAQKQIVLMPIDRSRGAYMRIRADSFKATPREIFEKVGKELGADGVLAGYVYRYREREGYEYAVKQPASVAFGVHLLSVTDGAFVWKGIFDKTQRTLMENVFDVSTFIRGRGKWVTAEQLSEEGADKILETFPGLEKK